SAGADLHRRPQRLRGGQPGGNHLLDARVSVRPGVMPFLGEEQPPRPADKEPRTPARRGAMDEALNGTNPERTIEFEFVRATENAALNVLHWLGRGDKEKADAAACDAINGVFDLVDISGEVVIGEGAKDNAPGLFLGDRLGTWKPGSPRFDVAVDPID